MAEVNLWPPTTSKREPLVQYTNNKALTVPPTSGRAQIKVQQKLPTVNTVKSTTERPSPRQIYEHTAMNGVEQSFIEEVKCYHISPSHLSTPEDPLAASIPPKPPYHAGPSSVMQMWQHTRPKNHRQASSPTNKNEMTTSNLRRGWAAQHDVTVICDSQL